ncbi:hypothetical protein HML84_03260 [Alcanivorax sp. IO_7]|nr:hypothetical protein HML84_03260 [Alcanivorax sp. IO_7]
MGPGLGDRVTVLEGLSAGDRVVVRGNESLSDGRELEVRRPDRPTAPPRSNRPCSKRSSVTAP